MIRSKRLWLFAAAVILIAGCRSGSSGVILESRNGSVVEDPARAAIPNADVFQVYWGPGLAGEPRPVHALRWTKANEKGAFAFQSELARDASVWGSKVSAAEYGFFHADFGLVRGGTAKSSGDVILRGRRLDAAGVQAMQLNLCGSRPADEVLAGAARLHCKRPR